MSILFNIILFGGILNNSVMMDNGGKMPVHSPQGFGDDYRHFSYRDPSQVNSYILTDIFPAHLGMFYIYYSIGDVFVILGLFFLVAYIIALFITDMFYLANIIRKRFKKGGRSAPLYNRSRLRTRPRRLHPRLS